MIKATKTIMKMKKLFILCVLLGFSQLKMEAQEIKTRNGFLKYHFYQNDKKISKNNLTDLLKKDMVAFNHWERANTFHTLSWIALASEIGFATWGIIDKNPKNDTTANIGVYGSFAAVLVFSIVSNAQRKKAIKAYNRGLKKSSVFTIKPSKTGFGLVMQF